MKKLLTITALLSVASLSFGQGFVNFANASSSRFGTNSQPGYTSGTNGSPVLAGGAVGSYYFALLVAPTSQTTIDPTSDPTLSGWTFTGDMGTNSASVGRMNGNNSPDGGATTVPGYGTTATADFAIVAWSANIGTTWAAAEAWWANGHPVAVGTEYFGISTVAIDIPLAPSGGPYNSPWGLAASGAIQGMDLNEYQTIPEPTTFALAGLGAAAVVIFRRRK